MGGQRRSAGRSRAAGSVRPMHHAQYCDALAGEAVHLVELVADPSAQTEPVPTCPGWVVADVVEHVGTLYGWSSAHVATAARAAPGSSLARLRPAGRGRDARVAGPGHRAHDGHLPGLRS